MPIKPSPAVLRASDILEFLARRPREPQSLSEIARRTGVSKATCQSLLLGLVEAGLVARHESSRRYGLGPVLIPLGSAAAEGHEVAQVALPEMERLSEALLLPVLGAVQAGARLVVVAATSSPRPFSVGLPTGQTVPFVPPLGAPFVAWSPAEDVEAWLARAPEPLDEQGRARLLAALDLVRRLGFGVTLDNTVRVSLGDAVAALAENPDADDVRARRDDLIRRLSQVEYLPTELAPDVPYRLAQISAPVFDHNGEVVMMVAATPLGVELGLAGIRQYGEAVRATADRVTASIGGAPPAAA
ncbi:MAG TPA: helix-turn-helix domain-containing protein [Acidimicrobiales bacterium]